MTPAEIKAKKEALTAKLDAAYKNIEKLQSELRALQKDCPHANKIDGVGGLGLCLDCGSKLP